MRYKIDFTNTGTVYDGIDYISTDRNDGTEIIITKFDDEGKLIDRKTLDIETLFREKKLEV